jgi:hypothetical protein
MRNRSFLTAAVLSLSLVVGGCGVDRAGTKEAMLKGLEGTGATDAQKTCLANSIDKFSDSELKKLNSSLEKKEETELTKKYEADLLACVAS